MVKPKSSQGHRKKGNQSASSATATSSSSLTSMTLSNLSVDQLLEKASECENRFAFSEALQYYNKALRRLELRTGQVLYSQNDKQETSLTISKHIKALRSSAYVLLELGRLEAAKNRFTQVLSLTSDPGYETYMYLGQLHEGTESLAFYRKGIAAISNQPTEATEIVAAPSGTNLTPQCLSRAESIAYCAIAELYMTDLCDLEEAQSECQKAFEAATHIDPSNPQAWLTAANFYTVIANAQAAREAVEHCLNLWWDKLESVLDQNTNQRPEPEGDDEEGEENIDLEEVTGIPSSGLIALVRMMLELEINEKAATILQSLLDGEEEDNLEVYYLLTAVGRQLWQHEDPQLLAHYATATKVMAAKLSDFEVVEEMTSLLAELPEPEGTPVEDSLSISSTSDEEELLEVVQSS